MAPAALGCLVPVRPGSRRSEPVVAGWEVLVGVVAAVSASSILRPRVTAASRWAAATHGFAWSPDGRKLVAVDGSGRLVVVDPRSETKAILATKGFDPAWSPDGRQIAFRDAKFNLELVPAGGGRARVVARNATAGPSWSPDGRRLLYSEYTRSTGERIQRLTVGSGRNTVLANDAGIPHWAPNGASIAYTRARAPHDPERDVWTMAAT